MLRIDPTNELRRIAAALVEDAPEPPAMPVPVPPVVARRAFWPVSWSAVGIGLAVAVAVVALLARSELSSAPQTFAVVQAPSLGASNGCGDVKGQPASGREAAQVTFFPGYLPTGYTQVQRAPAYRQERPTVSDGCWEADATYLDPTDGSVLAATLSHQRGDTRSECQVPDDYGPAECVTVQGHPAYLFRQGSRLRIQWITTDDSLASISAYGLTKEELLAAASTLRLDNTSVSLTPPDGMIQIEDATAYPEHRQVISYQAFFAPNTNEELDADSIKMQITTWGDLSINEVGPTRIVDLNGIKAIAVDTGGPGTGIVAWEAAPPGGNPAPTPLLAQTRGYITWIDNGVDFRLEGADLEALIEIARDLRHEP